MDNEKSSLGTKLNFRKWILKKLNMSYTEYMKEAANWRDQQYKDYQKGK